MTSKRDVVAGDPSGAKEGRLLLAKDQDDLPADAGCQLAQALLKKSGPVQTGQEVVDQT